MIGRAAFPLVLCGFALVAGADVRLAAADEGPVGLGPVVYMRATEPSDERFPEPAWAIGELEPASVLRMRLSGFDSFAVAVVKQCAGTSSAGCGNLLPVQLGEDGSSSFQYLVHTAFVAQASGGCRARSAPCSIVAEALEGNARAEIVTVFEDAVPPPVKVVVTPRSGLSPGDELRVEIDDVPPATELDVLLCAAPAVSGRERCEPLSPDSLSVAADRTASLRAALPGGPIGTEHARCRRAQRCGISVVASNARVRTPVVELGFATPPGADYDAWRLAAGLGAAALLVLAAVLLVRRTDWSPIGEEAAPEIDNAEYADLDGIIAALPPEEDDLDVLSRQ